MHKAGQHMCMRAAVQINLGRHLPIQAAKQRHVLALHMGVKLRSPARPRRAHRKPYRF
jgi:hypothetical protein